MIRTIAILAALTLPVAAPAHAFLAENGLPVERTGPDSFEVKWFGLSGAYHFWCAAGDYAVRGLNLSPGTEIYRYDAPVRGKGKSIRFGLDASRAQKTGLIRLQGGLGVRANHARRFCNDRLHPR